VSNNKNNIKGYGKKERGEKDAKKCPRFIARFFFFLFGLSKMTRNKTKR
jgi:hypothetical protein